MKWKHAALALIAAGAVLMASPAPAAEDAVTAERASPIAPGSLAAPLAGMPEPPLGAAEAGDAEALNAVGVAHLLGARNPGDYSMAMYWLQKAIDGGSANAMYNLARMYLHGIGTPRDHANAYKWFGRAAAGGCAHGTHVLAVMAESGLGTTRDLPLARAMYRRAALAGIPAAMLWVGDDLAHRAASPSDLVEAQAWLQVASHLDLDEHRQILVLARMEQLGAQLGPEHRDAVRARTSRIVAAIREGALDDEPAGGTPDRPSPPAVANPASNRRAAPGPRPISIAVVERSRLEGSSYLATEGRAPLEGTDRLGLLLAPSVRF